MGTYDPQAISEKAAGSHLCLREIISQGSLSSTRSADCQHRGGDGGAFPLSPAFASGSNLITLLESYSVMAIMAAGLLVVLISGGIDISFAAIAAVSQYVVATILVQWGGNWAVAFALAALFGGLLGVVNALLIHYLQALSVIVTISTMTFYFAILMFVTDGRSIYDLPDWFTATIAPLGIPFPVLVAAVVLVLTAVLLKGSPLGGRSMGWEATWKGQAHGVQPGGPAVLCLRLLGSDGGDRGVGAGASGGGSGAQCAHWARARRVGGGGFRWGEPAGGIGTVTGTILGIVLLAILQNGLTLMGVSSYSFGFVTGIIILLSVSATAFAAKRQQKRTIGNVA